MAHPPHDDIVAQIPHLRGFARSITGGNRHLADDLVQGTVVAALRHRRQFTPGTNLRAWLLRIQHNRFHSVMRRKHVTAEVRDDALLHRCSTPATQESRLELPAFKAAFAELSPVHREVLVLVLVAVHGLPYEQVAEICGCGLGTVKSRVNRARALLKKRLLGENASDEPPPTRATAAGRAAAPRGHATPGDRGAGPGQPVSGLSRS